MSFAAINVCVASQRIIPELSVYFVIDSVWKLLDTHSYITLVEEVRNTSYILSVKLEGTVSCERPMCTLECSMKMHLKGTACEDVDLIPLSQGRVQWWAFVNIVMNLRVP
jgi:hypothetical protein